MLFNSLEFLIFLPIVFIIYWKLKSSLRYQNLFLLIASYFFYAWWDYRFLVLIILSTLVDFLLGLKIYYSSNKKVKKVFLATSLVFNLSVLGFFKYYNFFIESWVNIFTFLGYSYSNLTTLNIILPVGISFYTFQTLSYSIDIYREKLVPTKSFISFATFVSFFPQLVAGPIERAISLLPQITNKREFKFNVALSGLRLILWGFFKKVVIADSLAPIVDDIFANTSSLSGLNLFLGAFFFSFQIYCDFSGYSDIAIGIARLFGIELMLNFRLPYFSRNIGEFWRRWHISLSTWFRDYIYIPLGGSRGGPMRSIRNVFVIFILSGFWHGANWTFIIWGALHALFFIPSFVRNSNRKYVNSDIEIVGIRSFLLNSLKMIRTFVLVMIGWIFFRSNTIADALTYISRLFYSLDFDHINPYNNLPSYYYISYILILILIEIILSRSNKVTVKNSIAISVILILAIMFLAPVSASGEFIYFQF